MWHQSELRLAAGDDNLQALQIVRDVGLVGAQLVETQAWPAAVTGSEVYAPIALAKALTRSCVEGVPSQSRKKPKKLS